MNPINRFFLFLLLLPSGVYRKMGVNIAHLRAILNAKLVMDDRRPAALQQTRHNKPAKPPRLATLGTMLLSAILGLIFLVGFAAGKDDVTKLTVYFSFYIFILASTLIADFTSVLIDVRDNMIILPKPIADKTFVLARLLHIVIHISKVVLPMTLPGMVYELAVHGWVGLLPFIFCVLSATFFTIFLINAMYIVILQVTTPAKFKAVISYFQIGFAIFFYGGYQLLPRLIGKAALQNYSVEASGWKWAAPPFWFAESWQFLRSFHFSLPLVTAFLICLLLPALSMWIVIRFFAPSFNSKLSMISGSEGGEMAMPVSISSKRTKPTTPTFITTIAGRLTQKGPERMSFLNTWKMTGRSREFKMKVYPSFGYLLVYMVVMFMNTKTLTLEAVRDQEGAGRFIFIGILYFSGFMLMMALGQIIFSDRYKAAWIYYITPVSKPGMLISGAVKSIITKFYFPIVIAISIPAVVLVGPRVIPNLILGVCNQVLVLSCIAYITIRDLPFSIQQSMNSKSGSSIRGLFSLVIPGLLAVLHYFLYSNMPLILLLVVLSVIGSWLVLDAIKTKTWLAITRRSFE